MTSGGVKATMFSSVTFPIVSAGTMARIRLARAQAPNLAGVFTFPPSIVVVVLSSQFGYDSALSTDFVTGAWADTRPSSRRHRQCIF